MVVAALFMVLWVGRLHLEVVKELVWEMNDDNGHMQNQQTQTKMQNYRVIAVFRFACMFRKLRKI